MTPEPDYITISPIDNYRALVMVMHYHKDDYIQTRVSQPLSLKGAQALAESWAAAMRLEIR